MKRICLILTILMLLFAMPLTAFAEGTPTPDTAATPTPDANATPAAATPTPASTTTPAPDDEQTPAPVSSPGQLSIDSNNLYPGMSKTYAEGYIPTVKDGKAAIILPLIGKTQNGEVTLIADLGATTDSPFVFGNYAQTIKTGEPYMFALAIPLASGRINGAYPVTLNTTYIDSTGALATQSFIIYVTITDGTDPVDPNAVTAPTKETVDKPELFISACTISKPSVAGGEEFEVEVTVENIGTLRARSVRLTYGGAGGGEEGGGASSLLPVETNNALHLENIAAGKSDKATFKLKAAADAISGNQPFTITLDYLDAYGGVYTSARQFLVSVSQPADFTYDDVASLVPESITAGESFTLPANVYNTGKSTLKNVMITVTGAGLFPKAAAFLGDITPGGAGNGELSIFAGQLSMTEDFTEDYGKTDALYTISYTDEAGEQQKIEIAFTTEIKALQIETPDEPDDETKEPAFQWWVTILVGFAIIAIIVAGFVVTKFVRAAKMK